MKANFVCRERDRGIADYAYWVDDDIAIIDDDISIVDDDESIIDDDDTICDDDRDGLTPEEAEAYNNECRYFEGLHKKLISVLGWSRYKKWCHTYHI